MCYLPPHLYNTLNLMLLKTELNTSSSSLIQVHEALLGHKMPPYVGSKNMTSEFFEFSYWHFG